MVTGTYEYSIVPAGKDVQCLAGFKHRNDRMAPTYPDMMMAATDADGLDTHKSDLLYRSSREISCCECTAPVLVLYRHCFHIRYAGQSISGSPNKHGHCRCDMEVTTTVP